MANLFAITTLTEDIKADANGKGVAVFTVTNTSGKPVRGIARARALGNTQEGWLEIDGETERDFSANGTQQFTVKFTRPAPSPSASPAAAVEKFPFRLDVASAANPDEVFTEGPQVNIEVITRAPVVKKPFPWWILIVVGAVLLLAVVVILTVVLTRGPRDNGNSNMPPPTVTPRSVVEVINFYDRSPLAAWTSTNGEALPFNGSDGDSRGFVKLRDGSVMENGNPGQKVLQTHPAWITGGKITGTYPLDIPINVGDRFRATVGFLQGAGAGNLTLRVLLNGTVVAELPKQYSGSLSEWNVDLSAYRGQSGSLSLQVVATPTSAQGWICWINPRIMNEPR
jgi:hypothetical protein